jgi:hypothetical protein
MTTATVYTSVDSFHESENFYREEVGGKSISMLEM